ncbi:MAG TPA: guanylate kinase [Armatimonadota bacterium]
MPDTPHYLPPYARRGVLFVLSGPSGVGKDALLLEATSREKNPENRVRRAITATTRPPRPAEVDGEDYHFWTQAQFRQHVLDGQMLEWAEVYGNLYGTPLAFVEESLAAGRSVVLKIDVQGAASVRRAMPDAVHIFLAPPSLAELESRLRNRLTDSDEAIDRRLSTALHEMQTLPDYDYVVVNDDLGAAADEVRSIFLAEQRRVRNINGFRPKP